MSNSATATTVERLPFPEAGSKRSVPALGEGFARLHGVCGLAARKGALTLLDQAVVSGTSFLTMVLIGRSCGAEELGVYSLGFTLVILAQTVLNSLVLVPYTVHVNRSGNRPQRAYAGATLIQATVLAGLVVIAMLAWVSLVGAGVGSTRGSIVVAWGLAAVLPFLILREFARRFAFAHFHAQRALALDAAVAAIQISGLVLLAATGWLTASRAFLVIGLACAAAGGTWFLLRRSDFRIRRRSLPIATVRNWRFGRWVFAGQLVAQLNSDIFMLWLLVFALGESASGVFAACMSIVFFSNPFILGVSHILTPGIARSFAEGGHRELRCVVARSAAFMGGAMSLFCVGVLLLGGLAIRTLYGDEFMGHEWTIVVLAVSVLIQSLGMTIGNGLWAIDRPDVNFRANLIGFVVTLTAAAILIGPWGLLGTAVALVIGHLAELSVRSYWFLNLTSLRNQEA